MESNKILSPEESLKLNIINSKKIKKKEKDIFYSNSNNLITKEHKANSELELKQINKIHKSKKVNLSKKCLLSPIPPLIGNLIKESLLQIKDIIKIF